MRISRVSKGCLIERSSGVRMMGVYCGASLEQNDRNKIQAGTKS